MPTTSRPSYVPVSLHERYDLLVSLGPSPERKKHLSCRIITTANFKGGVGKSTATVCLSEEFANLGWKILLVDADPQGTAIQWIGSAPPEQPLRTAVVGLAQAKGTLHRLLEPLLPDYDAIVIDCPPSLDAQTTRSALLVSNLCLMPLQPTPADFWATQGMSEMVAAVRRVNPCLKAFALANRTAKTRIGNQVLEVMREGEIELLDAQLGSRASFQVAAIQGSVPARMGSAHRKAAMEVSAVASEIIHRMGWQ